MDDRTPRPDFTAPAFPADLDLPLLVAPMFLVSGVELVVACCRNGVIGSFPALNARSSGEYAQWLARVQAGLSAGPVAGARCVGPYAVNLVVHGSNRRLHADLAITAAQRVPIVITSLGTAREVVKTVHGYGGLVLHDVISARHAEKALDAGVDGLIAVSAGAGGHGGTLNPFALLGELRALSDKPVVLNGALSNGRHVAAAIAAGASLAGMGTRFIATQESQAAAAYKEMLVHSAAADVVYTPKISGVAANFLKPSIAANGLDLSEIADHGEPDFGKELNHRSLAWKHIWSAGQGVGAVGDIPGVDQLCQRLRSEYQQAGDALRRLRAC